MRKFKLFVLVCLVVFNLFSCGESSKDSGVGSESSDLVFTQKKADSMKKYLSRHKYINIIQTIEHGVDDSNDSTKMIYSYVVDLESKILELSVSYSFRTNEEFGNYSDKYVRDYAKDKTVRYNNEDNCWEDCNSLELINWDFLNFNSVYDVYNFVIKDEDISIGTIGDYNGEYEEYKITKRANLNILNGLDYDEIGSQDSLFRIKDENGSIQPVLVDTKIIYYNLNTRCYIKNKAEIIVIGDYKLTFPEGV